jgi:peptidyl-prolyl cis-trans isomerase D
LENIYKKKEDFSSEEISKFIDEHNDTLKEKIISFRYSKITPKDLIGIDEFNNLFFEKIDDIENEISNGTTLENLLTKYQLKSNLKENFNLNEGSNDGEFYKKIYENAENNKLKLLDENDFYILYEISDIKELLPNIENENFIAEVKELLFNESKHQFNYNLIQKIGKKKFNQKDFDELSKMSFAKIENIEINSIKDNNKFSVDSIKYLYTLSKNNYALISDKDKNIYLIKIINISVSNISKNSKDFPVYKEQTNIKLRDSIYGSYDFFLNNKYKIKINEKTVERVKNYFR